MFCNTTYKIFFPEEPPYVFLYPDQTDKQTQYNSWNISVICQLVYLQYLQKRGAPS